MILDRYDDNDRFLRKIFASRGIPPVVKTAAYADDQITKHAADYAVSVSQDGASQLKYPIFDSGNALASALYFSEYGQQLPQEQQKTAAENIRNALESFGFTVPEELSKTASMELGFSDEAEDMSLEALFGSSDEVTIVKDAFNDCTPRGKRRLMVQVKEAGITVPEGTDAYLSEGLGSDLEMALDTRKLCIDPDNTDELDKLDSLLVKASAVDPEKLVKELEEFDVSNQLVHLYSRLIPDPYASVYGRSMEKAASAEGVEVNNDMLTEAEFSSLIGNNETSLTESFGETLVKQLQSDPVSVYNSLPTPHKKAIGNLLVG